MLESTKAGNSGTLSEAAIRGGVSAPTMRRYIAQGLVKADRVGPKLIRVDLESVDALGSPLRIARSEKNGRAQNSNTRRQAEAKRVEANIREVAATLPPFTAEQRDSIMAAFAGFVPGGDSACRGSK